ncbi:MAG: hypothetical protein AB8B46_04760 [Candidatus Midichloriaceae bacterium]
MNTNNLFLERLKRSHNLIYGDKKYDTLLHCQKLKSTIDVVSDFYRLQDSRVDICCDEEGFHISFLKSKSREDSI